MKYRIILIIILLIPIILESPTSPDPVETTHAAWVKCIPDWDSHSMETQEEIRNLYELSPNKHLWFPDSFPNLRQKQFMITPKNRKMK